MRVIKIPSPWAVATLVTILLVLYTTPTSSQSVGFTLDNTLPVHKLRAAYEIVQAKSWRLIEQQFAISGTLSETVKAKVVKELFSSHHQFIVEQLAGYERENKDNLRSVFPVFNHYYEWNYVQGHINATDSLFDVFRDYLAKNADTVSTELNILGAKDFAETVLYDKKWPIEKSFTDIHNIMVNQGLYYKLATVRRCFLVVIIIL